MILSSPFKRAVDTVADFAERSSIDIEIVENFRERKSDSDWMRDTDFWPFIERQWADFSYSLSDGECLAKVQERNIAALNDVLVKYKNMNIAIGTHGTALSTIINHYDRTYNFKDFMEMVNILPWVVRIDFSDDGCAGIEKVDLFKPDIKPDYDQCKVCIAELGMLKAYRFVVIFARYENKWLYCRAKERDTFETAGDHIEQDETPLSAAERELYEETGTISFDMSPAFDYSVHFSTGYSNGQVFFAQTHELGDIPDFEMAEVKLFDTFPDEMRFSKILPVLFEKVKELI